MRELDRTLDMKERLCSFFYIMYVCVCVKAVY